jgi:hypothetical protein
MPEKSHVGLLHYLCPVCCKTINTDILLDRRLRQSLEKDNYQLSNQLCEQCKIQSETHIALVEVNNGSHSDTLKPNEAIRTGRHAFLKFSAFTELFGHAPPKFPYLFCDQELMDKLISMAPTPE